MADDKENENELTVDDNSGKKKKMMMIIILVVVLIAGGGGAFFFMSGDDAAPTAEMTDESGEVAAEGEGGEGGDAAASGADMGTAVYVPMPRPFRFNVPGSARDRFVEIRVQLLVRSSINEENAKKHIPLLESTLLTVFSQANADDLATSAGKDALKQQALTSVQQVMKEVADGKTIEKVLFTGFVMQ